MNQIIALAWFLVKVVNRSKVTVMMWNLTPEMLKKKRRRKVYGHGTTLIWLKTWQSGLSQLQTSSTWASLCL